MGGEARDPQRDISRAVIIAMIVGTALYLLLEIAFIGGLSLSDLTSAHSWAHPFGKLSAFGCTPRWQRRRAQRGWRPCSTSTPSYPPPGTGLLYVGTSSRLSYALGRERTAPKALAHVSSRGVPLTRSCWPS